MPPRKRADEKDPTYAPPDERVNTDNDPEQADRPHELDAEGRCAVCDQGGHIATLRKDIADNVDGYGRTNHALTEDQVHQLAEEAGNLREDGRPKASVFYDDIEGARVNAERARVEAIQFEKDDTDDPDKDARKLGEVNE